MDLQDVRKLMGFLTSIANAGAPDHVVERVLKAGLKGLAKKAEAGVGAHLPRTYLDHLRGDQRWN
jgi:hypothetical protein